MHGVDDQSPQLSFERHRPIVELFLLAAPAVAQMASYTVMQFIDTWLLTRIGDTAATAGGNGGMIAFSAVSVGYGALLLVNTFASQAFGKRNYQACGQYLWQGLWFALIYALLLVPLIPLARVIFRGFGHTAELVRLESLYTAIVLSAMILKLSGVAMGQFLIAISRPAFVTLSTVVGVSVNALAAYGLVLGHFGLPRMGVVGSALAQNIGVGFETLTLLSVCLAPAVRKAYGLRQWQLRWRQFISLVRVGLPSGLQFVGDVLAWSLFSMWVMAPFGTDAMAANTYTFRYMSVSFMPAIGVGTAVTALVGRCIGAGRPDLAAKRTRLGFRVTLAYMVGCGMLFYFGRHVLMGLFTHDPRILAMGASLLIFAGIYQVFDAMYIISNGALRGAGDTFVPAIATAGLNWSITVGVGRFVAVHWPKLGVVGPWIAATIYGMSLGIFLLVRFRLGGWKSIRLEMHSHVDQPSAKVPGSVQPLPATDTGN